MIRPIFLGARLIYPFMLFLGSVGLVACAGFTIDRAISNYQVEAEKVKLGDSKDQVLAVLLPTQEGLSSDARKSREAFTSGSDVIEIYFFRSARQPDGLTTDDEFTPYVFKNNVLTGIGWTVLGGPKTSGQVVPESHTTVIEQPAKPNFTCMKNGPFLNCH